YDFDAATIAAFRSVSPRLDLRVTEGKDQAAVDALAATDLDGLIAHRLPSDLSRTPSLRWLQVPSAGVEVILGGGGWPDGIVLTNARGVYALPIGQYTIAAILRVAEHVDARREQQLLGERPDD